jgi:hypothetical protein
LTPRAACAASASFAQPSRAGGPGEGHEAVGAGEARSRPSTLCEAVAEGSIAIPSTAAWNPSQLREVGERVRARSDPPQGNLVAHLPLELGVRSVAEVGVLVDVGSKSQGIVASIE